MHVKTLLRVSMISYSMISYVGNDESFERSRSILTGIPKPRLR